MLRKTITKIFTTGYGETRKKNRITVLRTCGGEIEKRELPLRSDVIGERCINIDPAFRGKMYSLLFTACSRR